MCSAKIFEFKNQNTKKWESENAMLDIQGIDISALTKILAKLNVCSDTNNKFDPKYGFDEIIKELNNIANLKADLVSKFDKLKLQENK